MVSAISWKCRRTRPTANRSWSWIRPEIRSARKTTWQPASVPRWPGRCITRLWASPRSTTWAAGVNTRTTRSMVALARAFLLLGIRGLTAVFSGRSSAGTRPCWAPGLLQAVSCQGAVNAANAQSGNQCLGTGGATPITAFRLGLDGMTAPLPPAAQTIPQPFLPGAIGCSGAGCVNTNYFPQSGDALALDPSYRPPQIHSVDFTIQRELSSKISIEVGYIGRFISHELVDLDINAVPYMTTLGGQSFAQAYATL